MTDSLGEFLLKPTSLDIVDADSCMEIYLFTSIMVVTNMLSVSELFRVRVDSNIEKERDELMSSEKENWLGEGMTPEENLQSLKERIVTHQQVINESAQLILEEFEKQKKKFNTKDIVTYDVKNDDLINQLLAYNGAASEGIGNLLLFFRIFIFIFFYFLFILFT